MLILSLRTDKPDAELGIFEDTKQLNYVSWLAHRQLAETIHLKLKEVLESSGHDLGALGGIVIYEGPGSFTGLRIGHSVANALAYSLNLPIVGSSGEQWLESAISKLLEGQDQKIVLPKYGALPNVTLPREA